MIEKFNLRYLCNDRANTKYRDPAYNEKRMWSSRIIAQFINEDAIIISIDESNFKSDCYPSKQWQFNNRTLDPLHISLKRKRKRPMLTRRKGLLLRTDNEISYGQYLKQLSKGEGKLKFEVS